MTYDATASGLQAAFQAWADALNTGDLDAFYAFFDEESEVLDEDYPWRLSKAEFIDHINFHAAGGGRGCGSSSSGCPAMSRPRPGA